MCARCLCEVAREAVENCWYCESYLCEDCFERYGVCCPAGDRAQSELKVASPAERAAIMLSPGPIGRVRRGES